MADHELGGSGPGWQNDVTQQRYLLDDGRLFFESGDALLPQASDGRQNVYEREPDGLGSCQSAGGCLYLLSTGSSHADSYFIDASESGDDVFIETEDRLAPTDRDEAQDVYDVRVDGGFPFDVAPPCNGEACKPPITPAPAIYQAPPSATFFGAGNLAAPSIAPVKKKTKTKLKTKKRPRRSAPKRHGKRSKKGGGRPSSVKHAKQGRKG